jgi:hypothetical protein
MRAVAATPIDEMNPSQNHALHCAAIQLDDEPVIERSWYIKKALILPPTVLISASSEGTLSQMKRASPLRARSNPLAESLMPTQLSCTHGRKKQIKTKAAKLKVARCEPFIAVLLIHVPKTCFVYSPGISLFAGKLRKAMYQSGHTKYSRDEGTCLRH